MTDRTQLIDDLKTILAEQPYMATRYRHPIVEAIAALEADAKTDEELVREVLR